MLWSIAGVLAAAALIMLAEAPRLWRQQALRELLIFVILLGTGTGLGIAQAADWNIPNPLDLVSFIFRPLGEWINRTLA